MGEYIPHRDSPRGHTCCFIIGFRWSAHLQLDDLVRDEVGGVLELDGRLERDRGGELPVEEW